MRGTATDSGGVLMNVMNAKEEWDKPAGHPLEVASRLMKQMEALYREGTSVSTEMSGVLM